MQLDPAGIKVEIRRSIDYGDATVVNMLWQPASPALVFNADGLFVSSQLVARAVEILIIDH
jgi:hypothetical protein